MDGERARMLNAPKNIIIFVAMHSALRGGVIRVIPPTTVERPARSDVRMFIAGIEVRRRAESTGSMTGLIVALWVGPSSQ